MTKREKLLSWNIPQVVIFMKDGSQQGAKGTKTHQVEITHYFKKYTVNGQKVFKQDMFDERAYMEMMEECHYKLQPKKDGREEHIFKTIYTVHGQELATMEDLRNFILDRRREILDKQNLESRIATMDGRKSSAASHNPLSETRDVKVNRVRFVSPATIRSTQASVSEDDIRKMPPPVLLLSNDGMFRGLRS